MTALRLTMLQLTGPGLIALRLTALQLRALQWTVLSLTALGLTELVVPTHAAYRSTAVRLGVDMKYFAGIRGRLVDANLQRPRNPFWDMRR